MRDYYQHLDPVRRAELNQLLARCDEQTREVFDVGTRSIRSSSAPVGAPGSCIRPTDRVLSLGCPFLKPRPEYQGRAEHYQAAYAAVAADLEAHGNPSEAREHRRLARLCGNLIHDMDLLRRAESTRRWRPHKPGLMSPDNPPQAEPT